MYRNVQVRVNMQDNSYNNYINISSAFAILDIANLIEKHIAANIDDNQQLIILCIGTDRSTGDALGPLVGYRLSPFIPRFNRVSLFGTLNEPIHAKNLKDTILDISSRYINPFILAIDASLGNLDKIGYINVRKGPLKPGLGVNKNLPLIGDVSITGIVNIGGIMEYMVLQNTRLNLVMNMADIISKGIYRVLLVSYGSYRGKNIIASKL